MKYSKIGILLCLACLSIATAGYAFGGPPTNTPDEGAKAATYFNDYAHTHIFIAQLTSQDTTSTPTASPPAVSPADTLSKFQKGVNTAVSVANSFGVQVPTYNDPSQIADSGLVYLKHPPSKASPWTDWLTYIKGLLGVLLGALVFFLGHKHGASKVASVILLFCCLGLFSSCAGIKTLASELKSHCKISATGNSYSGTGTYCLTCDSLSQVIPKKLAAIPTQ